MVAQHDEIVDDYLNVLLLRLILISVTRLVSADFEYCPQGIDTRHHTVYACPFTELKRSRANPEVLPDAFQNILTSQNLWQVICIGEGGMDIARKSF